MKVLLTGATGYIGHQLALKLANLNYKVNALVRNLDSDKIPQHENITPIKGNICDFKLVDKLILDCDIIINFAAESFVDRSIASTKS